MRSDISHLPAKNQRELEQIVRAIFEEFEDAHKLASGDRKAGRILKVILYGSIARGEGIYEPQTAKGYVSDYDILVIVNQDELAETEHWTHLEDRFSRDHVILGRLRHPVSLIVHTLQQVNNNLAEGRFFFLDVVKDGIALYQADDGELATPKPKRPADAFKLAREYYEEWFPSAGAFYKMFELALAEGPSQAGMLAWSKRAGAGLLVAFAPDPRPLKGIAKSVDPPESLFDPAALRRGIGKA
jgi:predicted nucleotidyltransferase